MGKGLRALILSTTTTFLKLKNEPIIFVYFQWHETFHTKDKKRLRLTEVVYINQYSH